MKERKVMGQKKMLLKSEEKATALKKKEPLETEKSDKVRGGKCISLMFLKI